MLAAVAELLNASVPVVTEDCVSLLTKPVTLPEKRDWRRRKSGYRVGGIQQRGRIDGERRGVAGGLLEGVVAVIGGETGAGDGIGADVAGSLRARCLS